MDWKNFSYEALLYHGRRGGNVCKSWRHEKKYVNNQGIVRSKDDEDAFLFQNVTQRQNANVTRKKIGLSYAFSALFVKKYCWFKYHARIVVHIAEL